MLNDLFSLYARMNKVDEAKDILQQMQSTNPM